MRSARAGFGAATLMETSGPRTVSGMAWMVAAPMETPTATRGGREPAPPWRAAAAACADALPSGRSPGPRGRAWAGAGSWGDSGGSCVPSSHHQGLEDVLRIKLNESLRSGGWAAGKEAFTPIRTAAARFTPDSAARAPSECRDGQAACSRCRIRESMDRCSGASPTGSTAGPSRSCSSPAFSGSSSPSSAEAQTAERPGRGRPGLSARA
jgi:hypothetical protein